MQKTVLYISVSLDGYIADKNGSVNFLETSAPQGIDLGYDDFYDTVDTIIMGRTTYNQVTTVLSPDMWVYEGRKTYVYTNREYESDPNVEFTSLEPNKLIDKIKAESSKDIWVVGGGKIVKMFLEQDLIDKLYIYVMPVLLGEGIRLFPEGSYGLDLKLESSKQFGDVVELIYNKN